MDIKVSTETEAWLKAEVAHGRFASVDEAVEAMVSEHRIAALDVIDDDHLWAKSAVDEALAALVRGEGVSLEEAERRLKERLVSAR